MGINVNIPPISGIKVVIQTRLDRAAASAACPPPAYMLYFAANVKKRGSHMKKAIIGFLGCGNIGGGVYRLLQDMAAELEHRHGLHIQVKRMLVKDSSKPREGIPAALLTENASQVLQDPDIQLIVECMGGEEPATDYMAKALKAGKQVVSANKMAIALNWHLLQAAAVEGGAGFHYEASVCGAIPIIRTLNESMQGNRVDTLMGIVNGTTNYILSRMSEEGLSYEEVLAQAQALGLAEPDPASDVDGFDAAYKLSVLASLAFHARIPFEHVHREGIRNVAVEDIRAGQDLGLVLKLLAVAKRQGEQIDVRVHPAFVPRRHPLASVQGAFNAVFLHGHACGDMMLYGRGAGSAPTAGAIVSDIVFALTRPEQHLPSFVNSSQLAKELVINDNWHCPYYLRFEARDEPGVLGHIATRLGEQGVSIESLLQRGAPGNERVPVIVITQRCYEHDLRRALSTINPGRAKAMSAIRLEGQA